MERTRQMERMQSERGVRHRGRGLDYWDVENKERSRDDFVSRNEKGMKRGTDRRI